MTGFTTDTDFGLGAVVGIVFGFIVLFDFYFYGDIVIETIITMFYSI